jgi:hypothetical protein
MTTVVSGGERNFTQLLPKIRHHADDDDSFDDSSDSFLAQIFYICILFVTIGRRIK